MFIFLFGFRVQHNRNAEHIVPLFPSVESAMLFCNKLSGLRSYSKPRVFGGIDVVSVGFYFTVAGVVAGNEYPAVFVLLCAEDNYRGFVLDKAAVFNCVFKCIANKHRNIRVRNVNFGRQSAGTFKADSVCICKLSKV